MLKLFSDFDISRTTFVSYWYLGAFFGSLPILWLERKDKRLLFQKGIWRVLLVSFAILGALIILYWTLQLTSVGVVSPIRTFVELLLSIVIGWVIFKERKELTRNHIIVFVSGIIGVILIVVSQVV